ncbi:hypothetical protein GBF38_015985 [Nibea albiflora]|uniref:Uncharacterized protein n=1 Tax=Nibea albiflora TaxID=240163 RepID=A0ACB7FH95_NIBAL|nr:hypothetical protein GBF38_015985 [Nibea albiflora]
MREEPKGMHAASPCTAAAKQRLPLTVVRFHMLTGPDINNLGRFVGVGISVICDDDDDDDIPLASLDCNHRCVPEQIAPDQHLRVSDDEKTGR